MSTRYAIGDTVFVRADDTFTEHKIAAVSGLVSVKLDDGTRWRASDGQKWGMRYGQARLLSEKEAVAARNRVTQKAEATRLSAQLHKITGHTGTAYMDEPRTVLARAEALLVESRLHTYRLEAFLAEHGWLVAAPADPRQPPLFGEGQ